MMGGASTDYFTTDGLGSISEITNEYGGLEEYYTYDAYGAPSLFDGTGTPISTSAVNNPFYFTGREYDFETGIYYYRARYYDPSLGRFLETDPLGYIDSPNLYAYVGNNPWNWVDPMGLNKDKNGNSNNELPYLDDGPVEDCSFELFSDIWMLFSFGYQLINGGVNLITKLGVKNAKNKVDDVLINIEKKNIRFEPNAKTATQEGNVTLIGNNKKVNIRVETHPLTKGGTPTRHGNIEIIDTTNGQNVKIKNIHITE